MALLAPKLDGEIAVREILSGWKGDSVVDACAAAFKIGMISRELMPERAKTLVELNCGMNKVDKEYLPKVLTAFENGVGTSITSDQFKVNVSKVAANDNVKKDDSIDAETLVGMHFAPLEYVIPGYVVEGLTVLGGRPKVGKSWLAYDFAVAVATGGKAMGIIDCKQGDVLYLALEDNRRRMKERILTVCPNRKILGISLKRLTVRTESPRIDNGLMAELDKWRLASANPRLAIIDVFMKVRPPGKKGENPYTADYDAVTPLQRYASEHRLAIVLVTHTRKMLAEDPLETINGTNGITGAADAVLVLNRGGKGVTLYGRGRDIEEIETAMRFKAGLWGIIGDANEVRKSDERRKIIDALKDACDDQTPAAIAKLTSMKLPNVKVLLGKMMKDGEVTQGRKGYYTVPFAKPVPEPGPSPE